MNPRNESTRGLSAATIQRRAKRAARAESDARGAAARAATLAVVMAGRCPECGAGLRRNLALTGWWQCEQYGSANFRADAARPQCGWQGFV